ncbi:hypothetical protein EI982_00810 (plasmid) [Haloplanus rallus]|uniref:Uncharacterized protein n=1 Tax=Haloplanus rallus TaxID=1816183 RepID=A0A6B9EZW8_9EURY|nr:hypothetical protein [Haloplanus rallus]QGX93415.1 hypothetical protein EI982_00810 [Haloplanus rallus]
MSTRSQLRFVQRSESPDEQSEPDRVAQIYRHSDGYPDSVLRDLVQLKQLLDETRTERGPAYAAAQFMFVDTLSTMALYVDEGRDRSIHADKPSDLLEPANMEHLDQPLFLLGHGVENPADGIHGDEEYLYVVELPARSPFDEPAEWTVKVSGHSAFPRWDGPTEEAFERANWQFNGLLEHALEELVAEPA